MGTAKPGAKPAAMQPPAPPAPHIHGLLRALVSALQFVPERSRPIHDRAQLPPALQKVVALTTAAGHSWVAWNDERAHVWLYLGQMSLLLSRTCGSPVLQVKYYRETGLVDTCNWVIDRHAKWRRWED